MAENKEIQFAIEAFEILSFSTSKPEATVRKDRLDFRIQHYLNVNRENKLVAVGFIIGVLSGKQTPKELAVIETNTTFKLKGIESSNGFLLPDEVVIAFLSIAYSNTRGALAAKAQGTIVGEVPLPLINPKDVFEQIKSRMKNQETES